MNTYKYITCAFAAFMLSGCEGQLDITNPNQPTDNTFWKTETDFKKAITSCYTPLKNWNGGYYGTRGLMVRISRADDIEFRNDIQPIYSMHRFTNDPNNSVAQNIFYQFYNAIYRANSILKEIEGKEFSEDFVKRSEEHTSELQSRQYLVCRLLLEKKNSSLDLFQSH